MSPFFIYLDCYPSGIEGINPKASELQNRLFKNDSQSWLVATSASYFFAAHRLDESFQAKALQLRAGQTFKKLKVIQRDIVYLCTRLFQS